MFNQKEYSKKYYLKNKERIKHKSHQNYIKNKDKINLRIKKWRKSLHGKTIRLSKKFNISYKKAKRLLKIKYCEICGDNFAIATDHDHKTGKIRGRLCYRCNRAMGAFQDSIKILSKAIKYLKRRRK